MINKAIIIDDNEEICAMLETEIGRNFNFKTRSFLSAEAFFEASDRDQSLFLVDMNLPGKDGAEIIRQIRRYDKLSPVFMISADQTPETTQIGLDAGADDFLNKPFSIPQLMSKVKVLVMPLMVPAGL